MKKPITEIGLDLVKSVLQVHEIDEDDEIVCRRKLSQSRVLAHFAKLELCLVSMETKWICRVLARWSR